MKEHRALFRNVPKWRPLTLFGRQASRYRPNIETGGAHAPFRCRQEKINIVIRMYGWSAKVDRIRNDAIAVGKAVDSISFICLDRLVDGRQLTPCSKHDIYS